jgi:hypothetical protein
MGNHQTISTTFWAVYGQPCWGLSYERQLNLSMNFGEPSLRVREPFHSNSKSESVRRHFSRRTVRVRGQWWLWIYLCRWRLSSGGLNLATGSSSLHRIQRALAELEGQKLVEVAVAPSTGATRFAFDLGCTLDCRRFGRDTHDELWTLYKPNGYVLAGHGDGTFRHERASARARKE